MLLFFLHFLFCVKHGLFSPIAQSQSDCLFSAGQVKKGQPRRTKTGAEWRLKRWQSWRSTKWPRKIWPRFWRLPGSLFAFGLFKPYGYGSIPINTIFRGMNIHLPAILMFTRGTRFWHTAILISYVQWTKLEKLQRIFKAIRLKNVIPAWHLLTSGPWMSSSNFPFCQDPPKVIWLQSLDFALLSLSKAPCASTKRVTLELWKKAKRNWDNGQLQSCKRPCTMIFEGFLNWWIPKPWVPILKWSNFEWFGVPSILGTSFSERHEATPKVWFFWQLCEAAQTGSWKVRRETWSNCCGYGRHVPLWA